MFDCKFSGSDLRLIELAGQDILKAVNTGSSFVFRGDANDAAVLCTDSSTFEIKETETSNSLLIMKNLAFPDRAETPSPNSSPLAKKPTSSLGIESDVQVNKPRKSGFPNNDSMDLDIEENLWVEQNKITSIAHSYFELKKIRPNLSRIHTLLFPSKYRGPEYEPDQVAELMTFEDLLDKIPASSQEIGDYLQLIRAFELDGFIRLMEEEYLFRVLSQMLNCIEENSWRKDNVIKDVLMNSLESLNLHLPIVLEKVFQSFFNASPAASMDSDETQMPDPDNGNIYSIKENETCRFLGEILLKPVGRFNLKDFLKAWQDSVPEEKKKSR